MPARPEIFISATTKDLKSCRQLVRDALLTLGCVPVVQDHFAPEAATVREMLRKRIAKCDAVIHLAGMCYGYEPQERATSEARRSYTQIEYDIARELKKGLYTFVCAPDFPYDAHEPEDDERRALQEQHRAALSGGDRLFLPITDTHALEKSVREVEFRFRQASRRMRWWLAGGLAVTVAILGLLYGLKNQADRSEVRQTESDQRAEHAERELTEMRAQLQQQTRLIALVNDKLERNAAAGSTKADPTVVAREETARQLGITTSELEKQLADEKTDVRALLARIDQQSAAAQAQADQWKKLRRDALTKLADGELAAGHYREAVEPYQQALALCDEDKDLLIWCAAAQKLEVALFRMGRYAEAEPVARRLVERRTALQGGEHPSTLNSLSNLAVLLKNRGDRTGAELLYLRCLEAQERTLGKEATDTLNTVNNLATTLYAKGDYPGAELLFRRNLEARERTLGREHPDTLSSLNNLASLLDDEGKRTEAEQLFRRCLEARERTLGKEHPSTLGSVNNLAVLLDKEENYEEAEPFYRRCLEAQERTLGREHPNTLMSVNNLAILLKAKGDRPGAEALYRRCVEARVRTLGWEHPETLSSVNNLAVLLATGNDAAAAEAETLYRRCLETLRRTLGKNHPDTAETAFNFSLLWQLRGKLDEACKLVEEAVAAAQVSLPENHPIRRRYEQQLTDLQAQIARTAGSKH